MEDRDSLLKDAKSFLGKYSYLSPEDQKIALSAKHPRDLARLAEDNEGLFRSLQAFRKLESEGVISLPQSADSKNISSAVSGTVSGSIAGAGVMAAAGIGDLFKDKSYDGYKKSVQKDAEEAAKAWEKEEEKLRKENEKLIAQGKKPKERDPDRFTSKEEYIVNHLNTSHDNLALSDPKKARKWAQEHPEDLQLSKAIDRSQMWNKKLTFEEFEKIRNSYIEKSSRAGASPSEIAKLQAKANSELNNLLVRANPELAKSWAIQHGDRGLATAHNASRQRQVDYAKKNQGRISKFLGRDPAKKFGNEIKLPEPSKPPIATRMTQMAAAGAAVSAPSGGDASWGRSEPIKLPPPMPRPMMDEISQSNTSLSPRPRYTTYSQTQPTLNRSGSYNIPGSRNPKPIHRIAGRNIGRNASSVAKNAIKSSAKKAGKKLAYTIFTSPAFWIGFGIFFAFLVIMLAIRAFVCDFPGSGIFPGVNELCGSENEEVKTIPGTTITLEAVGDASDGSIDNNQSIDLRVTITIDPNVAKAPNPQDLILYVRPDFDYTLISAAGTHFTENNQIIWKLIENPQTPSNKYVFDFTLKPGPEEINKSITLTALVIDSSGNGISTNDYLPWDKTLPVINDADIFAGKDEPPSHYTCNDKYIRIMNQLANSYNSVDGTRMATGTGTNFGDPVCSFSDLKLKAIIAEYEPKASYREFWYDIARCESPGNGPNGWDKAENNWGHFQMDRSYQNPGKVYNLQSTDFDRGDLTWQNQVREAVKRNKEVINESFDYWAAARCLCSYPKHGDKSYCSFIKNKYSVSEMRGYCTSVCPNY